MRIALIALFALTAAAQDIVRDVKAAVAKKNFELGEKVVQDYRARQGITPQMIEAESWLGRGALAAGQYDRAIGYVEETRKLASEALQRRKLDAEPHLPLALGAAIEVEAQVMAARGERGEGVAFLRRELQTYGST